VVRASGILPQTVAFGSEPVPTLTRGSCSALFPVGKVRIPKGKKMSRSLLPDGIIFHIIFFANSGGGGACMLRMTNHAQKRCAERRITHEDIWDALCHGHEVATNANCRTIKRGQLYVIMSNADNTVVTVFRKMGIKRLLKKARQDKRRWRREGLHSPRF